MAVEVLVSTYVTGLDREREEPWPLVLSAASISLRELIRAKVAREVAEYAAGRRRMVGKEYLTLDELAAFQAAAGRRRAMPLDVAEEVRRAFKAFEEGDYMVTVAGRQVHDLDALVAVEPGARIQFLRLLPVAGGAGEGPRGRSVAVRALGSRGGEGAMFDGVVGWPQDAVRRYRGRGYWAGITLGEAFDRAVARHALREAVVDARRRITYGELGRFVDRLASHLARRGIAGGRRVIFQLPNVWEFVAAYFACLKVGAVPVACLPAHRHTEIEHLARITEACAWLIPSEFRRFDYVAMAEELRGQLPGLREVFVVGDRARPGMTYLADLLEDAVEKRTPAGTLASLQPGPGAPAVFQLSGGTTGLPKVIPRSHDDYLYNSMAFAAASGFTGETTLLVAVPIAHNFPLACPGVQGAILLGAKVVLAPGPDPETVFSLIERERVTWVPAVPAMVITWLDHPGLRRADLSSLKALYVGGSRLNPEPARRVLAEIGPVVGQVFGMAEGLLCCTRPGDPEEVLVETQGRPVSPEDEIRIVDEAGRDVAPGQVGELICRGPYTIRGYYRAEEHNLVAFTAEGFYRTGDLVRRHPSGNLVVEGRRKDLINRGGEKINAEEVENLILAHPAAHNAAAVAMPDTVLGERTCVYVILRPGATLTLEDLHRFLEERRIAKFKYPERLEVVESFPTTAVGKVSKAELRRDIARKLAAEAPAAERAVGAANLRTPRLP